VTGASEAFGRLAMRTRLLLRGVTELGPSTTGAIVTSSAAMAVQRRRQRLAEGGPAVARGPGRFLAARPLVAEGRPPGPIGIVCRFTEADLEVRFLAEDVVRLTWGPGDLPLPWALADPEADHRPAGTVEVSGPSARSTALCVEVGAGGEVSVFDAKGRLLRRELPPLRRGARRTARHLLRAGEHVAGLGEQASPVTLRGTVHRLWNRDPGGAWGPGDDPLYLTVPVVVGAHPDGDVLTFYENSHDAEVRIDGASSVAAGARVEVTFGGGVDRHYVMAGSLPRLLERYTWLTGRPPLPPRWALGFHQCRWGYRSEGEVREVAQGFAAEGLPLSAVHLDIDHMDGYRVFTTDPRRFPDLADLCGELDERGTKVVVIVDPAVKADDAFSVFREGRDDGRFVQTTDGRVLFGVVWPGRAAFPDFTDPATRRWWAGLYKGMLDAGVSGFWHDMNEPTSIALWGDRTLPPGTPHAAEGRGGDHRECHNVYGLLMDQAGFEGQAEARPGRRPWVLSRSGWAGVQRWAWTWTADVESSWSGLRQQIATAIGLGLSGVPYTGSDTGGFSGDPSPELFVRWLEMAVLMPLCRTHSVTGAPPREPWRWPDPYRLAVGRLVRLRYRLLPYLYTLAHEASRTGHPFVRPLCWPDGRGAAGDSDRLWAGNDAYLLGDALLVAPATSEGCETRSVLLPAGDWFRWRPVPALGDPSEHTDSAERLVGTRTAELDTPVGQPLVLVRSGTVLPLDDGWVDGADGSLGAGHAARRPAVHCFASAQGTAQGGCYDDAGDGYGPGRVDRFTLTQGPSGPSLSWGRDGAYPAPERLRVVVHGLAATRAVADGLEVAPTVHRDATGQATTSIECRAFDELRFER